MSLFVDPFGGAVTNGWVPVFVPVRVSNDRLYIRLLRWEGGAPNTSPPTIGVGQYLGNDGYVENTDDAFNWAVLGQLITVDNSSIEGRLTAIEANNWVSADRVADGVISLDKLTQAVRDMLGGTDFVLTDGIVETQHIANRSITNIKIALEAVSPGELTSPLQNRLLNTQGQNTNLLSWNNTNPDNQEWIANNFLRFVAQSLSISQRNQVKTNLGSGFVTEDFLADDSVTLTKLASLSVGRSQIRDLAVGTNQLANNVVNYDKLTADVHARLLDSHVLPYSITRTSYPQYSLVLHQQDIWVMTATDYEVPEQYTPGLDAEWLRIGLRIPTNDEIDTGTSIPLANVIRRVISDHIRFIGFSEGDRGAWDNNAPYRTGNFTLRVIGGVDRIFICVADHDASNPPSSTPAPESDEARGRWIEVTALAGSGGGAAGPPGPQGDQGIQGIQGIPGEDGEDGEDGGGVSAYSATVMSYAVNSLVIHNEVLWVLTATDYAAAGQYVPGVDAEWLRVGLDPNMIAGRQIYNGVFVAGVRGASEVGYADFVGTSQAAYGTPPSNLGFVRDSISYAIDAVLYNTSTDPAWVLSIFPNREADDIQALNDLTVLITNTTTGAVLLNTRLSEGVPAGSGDEFEQWAFDNFTGIIADGDSYRVQLVAVEAAAREIPDGGSAQQVLTIADDLSIIWAASTGGGATTTAGTTYTPISGATPLTVSTVNNQEALGTDINLDVPWTSYDAIAVELIPASGATTITAPIFTQVLNDTAVTTQAAGLDMRLSPASRATVVGRGEGFGAAAVLFGKLTDAGVLRIGTGLSHAGRGGYTINRVIGISFGGGAGGTGQINLGGLTQLSQITQAFGSIPFAAASSASLPGTTTDSPIELFTVTADRSDAILTMNMTVLGDGSGGSFGIGYVIGSASHNAVVPAAASIDATFDGVIPITLTTQEATNNGDGTWTWRFFLRWITAGAGTTPGLQFVGGVQAPNLQTAFPSIWRTYWNGGSGGLQFPYRDTDDIGLIIPFIRPIDPGLASFIFVNLTGFNVNASNYAEVSAQGGIFISIPELMLHARNISELTSRALADGTTAMRMPHDAGRDMTIAGASGGTWTVHTGGGLADTGTSLAAFNVVVDNGQIVGFTIPHNTVHNPFSTGIVRSVRFG